MKCKKCGEEITIGGMCHTKAAQKSMHLTAFRRGLAWVIWGVVTLLSILFLIIGGR